MYEVSGLNQAFERVTWITWHLPGLNSISQVLSQCWRDFKSGWSTWLSCMLVTVRYTAVSSANNLTWDWMFSGRSLMYNKKRSGPRTEPWGTPEVTLTSSDDSPSSTTVWVRPIRNDWIQFKVFPFTPKQESLNKSFRWFTLSKALLKSKSIKSVCFPKDSCLPKSSTRWINWVSH